jgi:DNA recombination protein RmuC
VTVTLLVLAILAAAIVAFAAAFIILQRGFEARSSRERDIIIEKLRDSFGSLSYEALSKNSSEFLKIAHETLAKQSQGGQQDLEAKKERIDQTLGSIREELQNIHTLVRATEKESGRKFGEIAQHLRMTAEGTEKLHQTASQLKNALTGTAARGQWGQRMAEDILRLSGFIEGINYLKEKQQATVETRPDYTFLLPQGLKINMDVKFPMNNYLRYLEMESPAEKERLRELFLRDARSRIKEVTTRDYINPAEKTVDYVIVFIPNEQIYSFINENDHALLDDALKSKVIFCSPLTLYAILAVIRQAVDNFNLEQKASQILALLGAFYKQWDAFTRSFDKLGTKIKEAGSEYEHLTTTRSTQLERQLRKLEELRKKEGMSEGALPSPAEIEGE